jgi:hypothetical protein
MNAKKNKRIKLNPFFGFSPMFEWVYENGMLVSRIDHRYKTYLKRGFLYNKPAAYIHKTDVK